MVASWTWLVAGCCVAAPSPVTSLSLIGRVGGVITLLCMCLEKHLREDGCASLSCLLSSGVAGPTVPAGPGGYNTHPILYSAYFAIKRGVFFPPSSCKNSPRDPPPGIVASPCVDVWLLVRIHLLFCALDFKENQRGPIMLMDPVQLNAIKAPRINPLLNICWLEKLHFF